MASAVLRDMAMLTFYSRAGITICSFACGLEHSGICFPAIRQWPRLSDARPAFAARSGWISWNRLRSRDARGPAWRVAGVLMRTYRSIRNLAIGKSLNTSIACGDDASITRTLIRRAGADT